MHNNRNYAKYNAIVFPWKGEKKDVKFSIL